VAKTKTEVAHNILSSFPGSGPGTVAVMTATPVISTGSSAKTVSSIVTVPRPTPAPVVSDPRLARKMVRLI
jgi:hypothetical protein